MTDNRTTELKSCVKCIDDMTDDLLEIADVLEEHQVNVRLENGRYLNPVSAIRSKVDVIWDEVQAIAATLGSERELIDLAHNAWSMALCAMKGMPIPAEWGDAVERGLRKHGIDVDGELAGFEVVDE